MRLVDIQSNLFNKDTEGTIKSVRINELGVRIKRVEFRENVRAFFPKEQSKLSVIMRCLYLASLRKAEFDDRWMRNILDLSDVYTKM